MFCYFSRKIATLPCVVLVNPYLRGMAYPNWTALSKFSADLTGPWYATSYISPLLLYADFLKIVRNHCDPYVYVTQGTVGKDSLYWPHGPSECIQPPRLHKTPSGQRVAPHFTSRSIASGNTAVSAAGFILPLPTSECPRTPLLG